MLCVLLDANARLIKISIRSECVFATKFQSSHFSAINGVFYHIFFLADDDDRPEMSVRRRTRRVESALLSASLGYIVCEKNIFISRKFLELLPSIRVLLL